MRARGGVVVALAVMMVVAAAGPSSANLSRGDPNDIRPRGDIKRSTTTKYSAPWGPLESVRWVRTTMRFYDRVPWRKRDVLVTFDTKGGQRGDYDLQMFKYDTPLAEGWPRFTCWLRVWDSSGADLLMTYDDGIVASHDPRMATCAFPLRVMRIRKTVRWRVSVSGNTWSSFDFAPDRGWYPHL